MKKRSAIVLALLAGCSSAPIDTASSGSPTGGTSIFTCCGDSDSILNAQMRRFDSTPEGQRPPEVAVFPYHSNSGITVRDRIVVTDPVAWSKIWLNIAQMHSPTPALPAADFARETIVIAAMGQRNSGGYGITIDSSVVVGDTITLIITERSPGRTCGTTAALTAPIALARSLRPRATVRFVEKTAVTDRG
jgi:hypothetical protein